MHKPIYLVTVFMLVVIVLGVVGPITPAQAVNPASISCDGKMDLTISFTPVGTVWYRVDGTGPGLPTAWEPVTVGVTVTLTWTLSGPGDWSGLVFQGDGGSNGGWWGPSLFDGDVTAECVKTVSKPVPVPGPDMVPIPEQAVVGAFVTDTVVYFEPQADAATDIVIEAGKTLWVYGVDESGAYYKVMLSGKLFWVPVSTMGPNYDDVWNGWPLPTDVVE